MKWFNKQVLQYIIIYLGQKVGNQNTWFTSYNLNKTIRVYLENNVSMTLFY